jgi:hypothetical protein
MPVTYRVARVSMQIRKQLGKQITLLRDALRKLGSTVALDNREVRAQRMCPFCGLITPRHKAVCLECGKAFKPA